MTADRDDSMEERMSEKMWGDEPFWGLGYDWDPDWVLDRPPARSSARR